MQDPVPTTTCGLGYGEMTATVIVIAGESRVRRSFYRFLETGNDERTQAGNTAQHGGELEPEESISILQRRKATDT